MTSRHTWLLLGTAFFVGGILVGLFGLDLFGPGNERESGANPLALESAEQPEGQLPTGNAKSAPGANGGANSEGRRSVDRNERPAERYARVQLTITVDAPEGHELEHPVHVRLQPIGADAATRGGFRTLQAAPDKPEFEVKSLTPGLYQIVAWSKGLDLVGVQVPVPDVAPVSRVPLTLLAPISLSGRLLTEGQGAGLPSVEVHLVAASKSITGEKNQYKARTNDTGGYHFPAVLRGTYDLYAGPVHRPLRAPSRITLSEMGSVQDIRDLPAGGELLVQVMDAKTNPIGDVAVTLTPVDKQAKGGGHGRTDQEGLLRVGGLPPGKYHVSARKDGYSRLTTRCEVYAAASQPLRLTIRASGNG